jgi:hypothetical protein
MYVPYHYYEYPVVDLMSHYHKMHHQDYRTVCLNKYYVCN